MASNTSYLSLDKKAKKAFCHSSHETFSSLCFVLEIMKLTERENYEKSFYRQQRRATIFVREAKTFFDFSEMDFNSLWDENIISEDDDGDLPSRILLKTIIIIIIFSFSCSLSTCESFPSETKSFISSFGRKSSTSFFCQILSLRLRIKSTNFRINYGIMISFSFYLLRLYVPPTRSPCKRLALFEAL